MQVLARFYAAMARGDWAAMGACYHAEARFSDPVFPALDGPGARAMWRMLLSAGAGLRVTFRVLEEDAAGGRARWQADYVFGPAARPVRNVVLSEFRFRDGLIVEQRDRFDLWRWARQALGWKGLLLGWSPWLHRRVRAAAAKRLAKARKEAALTGPPSPNL